MDGVGFKLHHEILDLNGHFKARITAECNEVFVDVDTLNLSRAEERKLYVRRLADKLDMPAERIDAELDQIVAKVAAEARRRAKQAEAEQAKADPLADTPKEILAEAHAMLAGSNLIDRIAADIETIGVVGERQTALLVYLIGTSRKLARPLAAVIQAASAAGKSFLLRQIASLFPPEEVLSAHSITAEALYYMPPGSLSHKFVVSGERVGARSGDDEAEPASKAFREMVADGQLTKLVTAKDEKGQLVTRHIVQPGPIAYCESTTASQLFDEDATRMLLLTLNESPEQTAAVQARLAAEAAGQGPEPEQQAYIREIHRTAQRLLRSDLSVLVPFAGRLRLPSGKIACRRAYSQLLSVIQAVAFLHQKQRRIEKRGEREYIIAEPADYAIAAELLRPVLARLFDPLPSNSRKLLAVIEANAEAGHTFTRDDLVEWSGVSYREVVRRLGPLTCAGYLSEDRSTKPYRLRRTGKSVPGLAELGLPAAEHLVDNRSTQGEQGRPPASSPENPAECAQVLENAQHDYAASRLPKPAAMSESAANGNIRQAPCLIIKPSNNKDLRPNGEKLGEREGDTSTGGERGMSPFVDNFANSQGEPALFGSAEDLEILDRAERSPSLADWQRAERQAAALRTQACGKERETGKRQREV